MKSEDTVEDPLMSFQFYIKKRKSVFISCYSPSIVFIFSQKTLKSVFLPCYEPLKLNHDKIFLMTSEDTVEDPLISFQFYKNKKSFFSFRVTVHLLFSFLLQKTLESDIEDPLMSVQFYWKNKSFSFRVTVHLLFSFLLQEKLKSVFLPRYESLKLNHDTNYLMKSEDTVEDPLMSFQFYINSKSVFISCYSPSIVFIFIAKDAEICISTMLWIFKTEPWQNVFDDIWNTTRLKIRWWVFNFI